MSNQKTITLGQRKREVELTRDAQKAQDAVDDFVFETDLLNSFKQRVEAGEFKDEVAAREVCKTEYFDVDPSQETADALEAFLSLDRDWDGAHSAWASEQKSKNTLENQWAQVRADLQRRMGGTHQGNGFSRTVSMERNGDGSVTIPAEMIGILIQATEWSNKGKIQKVSGFVNATESGAITLEVKVSNPAKD